jgi:hypothetical protein
MDDPGILLGALWFAALALVFAVGVAVTAIRQSRQQERDKAFVGPRLEDDPSGMAAIYHHCGDVEPAEPAEFTREGTLKGTATWTTEPLPPLKSSGFVLHSPGTTSTEPGS